MNSKAPNKSSDEKPSQPTVIESGKLFGKDRKIQILHENKIYQLTITRQNKLILTK
ncbi:MAG: hemin uptake protein HemP [Pseudomonadota bacterium]